nr:uncharacterized protein LOC117841698 [Setaria viridis]
MEEGIKKTKRRLWLEATWREQHGADEIQLLPQVGQQGRGGRFPIQSMSLGEFQMYGDYICAPTTDGTGVFDNANAMEAAVSVDWDKSVNNMFMPPEGGYTGLLLDQIRTSQEMSRDTTFELSCDGQQQNYRKMQPTS